MNRLVLLLMYFLVYGISFGQKEDYVWLLDSYLWNSVDTDYDHGIIEFNNGQRNFKYVKNLNTSGGGIPSICNHKGQMLFYFSLCSIRGNDYKIIENGSHINESNFGEEEFCNEGGGINNSLILPDPINENGYYVIHKSFDRIKLPSGKKIGSFSRMQSSYVDMTANNGHGKVVYKDKVHLVDTFMAGYLQAVKHANNKDWWFIDFRKSIKDGNQTNKSFLFLLDENGIQLSRTYNIGPLSNHYCTATGSSRFSPLGNKFAYACPADGFWILDFDRATGDFTNYQNYNLIDTNAFYDIEWSPNGRFLYLSTMNELFQFDTWASDILSSKIIIGKKEEEINYTKLQRGPDCKIYISNNNKSLHVINYPDAIGLKCNLIINEIEIAKTSRDYIYMSSFPNYRLGLGPVCDPSITSSTIEIDDFSKYDLSIYPNPTSTVFRIESDHVYRDAQIKISDLQGKSRWQCSQQKTMLVNTDSFENGIYLVHLIHSNKILASSKLVVIK